MYACVSRQLHHNCFTHVVTFRIFYSFSLFISLTHSLCLSLFFYGEEVVTTFARRRHVEQVDYVCPSSSAVTSRTADARVRLQLVIVIFRLLRVRSSCEIFVILRPAVLAGSSFVSSTSSVVPFAQSKIRLWFCILVVLGRVFLFTLLLFGLLFSIVFKERFCIPLDSPFTWRLFSSFISNNRVYPSFNSFFARCTGNRCVRFQKSLLDFNRYVCLFSVSPRRCQLPLSIVIFSKDVNVPFHLPYCYSVVHIYVFSFCKYTITRRVDCGFTLTRRRRRSIRHLSVINQKSEKTSFQKPLVPKLILIGCN